MNVIYKSYAVHLIKIKVKKEKFTNFEVIERLNLSNYLQVFCPALCRHYKDRCKGRRGPSRDTAPENLHWQNTHHASVHILPSEQPNGP